MNDWSSSHLPRTLHAPAGFRSVESWRGRILTWFYPSRGWGGAQPAVEPASAVNRAPKPRPTPGKPAGFRIGDTR